MNPGLLFWIPNIIRGALLTLGAALVWWKWGLLISLLLTVLILFVIILVQLHYLHRLAKWLEHPKSDNLPDGSGAWADIFSRLYRLRRLDEKNEAELSEWLARFRQAMHLLPDGVAIMDDVLFLEWCNPAAEKHLGLSMERDGGMRVTNLVRAPEFIDYIVLGRYEQPLMLTHRNRKLIVQIIPFENRRQILVTHDATEANRIDMMRRDFIANASHELRTPLTVVVGFLEIALSDARLDEATRHGHLKLMSEQAQRMQSLVQDMLTLSRLESLDYPLRSERVMMRSLITQVSDDARALSVGRHQINSQVEEFDLAGNGDELLSAFGNLASNAVRYTPAGGVIEINWKAGPDYLEFSVQDNGIGIRPEHISRLTERFYRVDKGRSRDTKGTGLGLAIVKHVLIRHGATLVIESQPGKGSVFTARFPRSLDWALKET